MCTEKGIASPKLVMEEVSTLTNEANKVGLYINADNVN